MEARIIRLETVESTNLEVKKAIEDGKPEGLVVISKRQLGGYGRDGRRWESPEGGLYMSILIRPEGHGASARELPSLALVVGLAVIEGIERAILLLGDSVDALKIKLKWPNDVVWDEGDGAFRKLCGISVEGSAKAVCVGVGLNVWRSAPVSLGESDRPRNAPTYMQDIVDGQCDDASEARWGELALRAFEECILERFWDLYETWLEEGIAPFIGEYDKRALLNGRHISVEDRHGRQIHSGNVAGIDEEGRLVLDSDDGSGLIRVSSGEVRVARK